MKEKTKQVLFVLCCLILNGLTVAALIIRFIRAGRPVEGIQRSGWIIFRKFTNDGNLLAVVAGMICSVYCIFCIIRKTSMKSKALYYLRFMSAVSTVTIFVIVVMIFLPMGMIDLLTGYCMVVLHIVNPLLTVLSFLFLDRRPPDIGKKAFLYGGIPVFIYGIVSAILCGSEVWTGDMIPYPFFDVRNNPVWLTALEFIVIAVITLVLSFILDLLKKRVSNQREVSPA